MAIDEAVAREGWKIVLLTRLSPVFPFNLLNYAFGLTRVSLKHYFFASWLGMIPGTMMYVYIGSLAGVMDESHFDWSVLADPSLYLYSRYEQPLECNSKVAWENARGARAVELEQHPQRHDLALRRCQPVQRLVGFAKVTAAAGSSQRVTVALDPDAYRRWDVDQHVWTVPSARYELRIARSSRDIVARVEVRT